MRLSHQIVLIACLATLVLAIDRGQHALEQTVPPDAAGMTTTPGPQTDSGEANHGDRS